MAAKLPSVRQQHTDSRPLNDVQRTVSGLADVLAEFLPQVTGLGAKTLARYERQAGYFTGASIGGTYTTILTMSMGDLAAGQSLLVHTHLSDWNSTGGGSNSRHRLLGPGAAVATGPTQFFPNTAGATRASWDQVDTFPITTAGRYTVECQVQGGTTIGVSPGAGYLFEVSLYGAT